MEGCKINDKMKKLADSKVYVRESPLQLGDAVIKRQGRKRSVPPYDEKPLIIMPKKGSMITAGRGEKTVTRNSTFFKPSLVDADKVESED